MRPLITPEELAGYLQRDLDRYSCELSIQGASGVIRTFCGWGLTRTEETLTVDSRGGTSINLPTLRLNDVTEVRVDKTPLAASVYQWGTNGILTACLAWPAGLRRIEADVDHGYDPIPDELRIVTCSVAGRIYANPEGLKWRASGGVSKSFGETLSAIEMHLISAYRLA